MRNKQRDELFNYFISGLEEKLQAQLRYAYFRSQMMDEEKHRREMEQMKQEIIEEVMSRISILFETGEAINQIDGLKKAIDQLTQ